eukprot:augustus_masked-scaffold_53-processed-gene-1.38-mRNA-1 protein AED:0.27 eAED:0.27 QI:0/-1/0/1/-1/1/1/0/257
MAIGKNRKLGKKGRKKKVVDPFLKKEWYLIQAPNQFVNRQCGQTLVNRSSGTKIASEALKARVFEVNLADLTGAETDAYMKIKLIAEDIQGNKVLTNFHGLALTRDKEMSLMKKWQSMIEYNCDVVTSDGYLLRVFCVCFTQKDKTQLKKFCYAQREQKKGLRRVMKEVVESEIKENPDGLKSVVQNLIVGSVNEEMKKKMAPVYPVKDVHVRKVKVLKRPKFDLVKLMEVHGETKGVKDDGPAAGEEGVTGGGGRY